MKNVTKNITKDEIDLQYGYMSKVKALIGRETKYVCVQTFGCQQNEADSERLLGMAETMGYVVTDDPKISDLIVVNTCAVREHAELKTLSITGQFKHIKEKNPNLLIGICGCMVSQEHRSDDIKKRYPYVDFLFGTSENYRFPEIVYKALTEGKRQFYKNNDGGTVAEGLPVHHESKFKAWVSIMYGCNNFCTYCVVPYVRGRERSRKREDILCEIRDLISKGYEEITLLGQNVNSYGKDIYASNDATTERYDFADLLDDICALDGDFSVTFMTSHPKDVTKKLIDAIYRNPKIARRFHLPLQSGSDRILREMNRHYDCKSYLEKVNYMRGLMPEIAITTDIIVGFPGETEDDFVRTLDMLSAVEYDSVFSFIFSPRNGTPAAEMENQIPQEVKKERFARLLELQNEISRRKNEDYVGHVISVLVEGRSKMNPDKLTGRNEKNRLVHFSGEDELIGKRVNVKIDRAETYAVFGTVCED